MRNHFVELLRVGVSDCALVLSEKIWLVGKILKRGLQTTLEGL